MRERIDQNATSRAKAVFLDLAQVDQEGLRVDISNARLSGSFVGASRMTLGELLSQGGWSMIPIYLCSILAGAIFCQRWWFFRQIRAPRLPWVEPILQKAGAMHYASAITLCRGQTHPIARVLQASIELAQTRPDRVQAEAERVGENELQEFEALLPYLGLIAQMAPLLGLLGTVIGMVQMFLGLQQAGMGNVDASALSSGIWQALLTTAAGLIVAAPTLAALLFLQTRLDRFRSQMRDAVERLLHVIPLQPKVPTQAEGRPEPLEKESKEPLGATEDGEHFEVERPEPLRRKAL